MPNENDYRWRRYFRCAHQSSVTRQCGEMGDRAVIILSHENWKTHPCWYPATGFPVEDNAYPWVGLICKKGHLTLDANPAFKCTKQTNQNGNGGRWYHLCYRKIFDKNFSGDDNETMFLTFADETFPKMVTKKEYDAKNEFVKCFLRNNFESELPSLPQNEQSQASTYSSDGSKWASQTSFTSISKMEENPKTAPSDKNDNFITAVKQPKQDPMLSEESDSENDSTQLPKMCSGDCNCINCPKNEDRISTNDKEKTSIVKKIRRRLSQIFPHTDK